MCAYKRSRHRFEIEKKKNMSEMERSLKLKIKTSSTRPGVCASWQAYTHIVNTVHHADST